MEHNDNKQPYAQDFFPIYVLTTTMNSEKIASLGVRNVMPGFVEQMDFQPYLSEMPAHTTKGPSADGLRTMIPHVVFITNHRDIPRCLIPQPRLIRAGRC